MRRTGGGGGGKDSSSAEPVKGASPIIENFLFLGGESDANDAKWLQEAHVSHLLNCAEDVCLPDALPTCVKRVEWLKIRDGPRDSLSEFIPTAMNFINTVPEGERILVFCQMGRSRSVSMVIAYLMQQYFLDYDAALAQIRAVRPQADPNAFFTVQLRMASSGSDQFAFGAGTHHNPNHGGPLTDHHHRRRRDQPRGLVQLSLEGSHRHSEGESSDDGGESFRRGTQIGASSGGESFRWGLGDESTTGGPPALYSCASLAVSNAGGSFASGSPLASGRRMLVRRVANPLHQDDAAANNDDALIAIANTSNTGLAPPPALMLGTSVTSANTSTAGSGSRLKEGLADVPEELLP